MAKQTTSDGKACSTKKMVFCFAKCRSVFSRSVVEPSITEKGLKHVIENHGYKDDHNHSCVPIEIFRRACEEPNGASPTAWQSPDECWTMPSVRQPWRREQARETCEKTSGTDKSGVAGRRSVAEGAEQETRAAIPSSIGMTLHRMAAPMRKIIPVPRIIRVGKTSPPSAKHEGQQPKTSKISGPLSRAVARAAACARAVQGRS